MNVIGKFLFVAGFLVGCRETAAPPGPELACVEACKREMGHCDHMRCGRGCNLVLDRLVERERPQVFTCVSRAKSCDDSAWAECATHVGNYVDGGPVPEQFMVDASP